MKYVSQTMNIRTSGLQLHYLILQDTSIQVPSV